mgnify:FL=1
MTSEILRNEECNPNLLKKKGLNILSKLTGLFLAALASQLIFTGIRNIMFGGVQ